ncbi:FkbM family methyltransferase [Candidatus Pacearchaeota archaeon]|nr:FkbM family methyltransferase [Candidatus Pacearchaeota archaeon]
MKNLGLFFKKHGFFKGIGIIRRHLTLKLIYEPFNLKRKWIKINGYHFLLDFETGGISKGIYVMGSREILETEIVNNEVKEGDRCLDAGANIGFYCLLEAKNSKANIYAFEPDKRNLKILKQNLKKNNFNHVKVYEMALSDKKGSKKMYLTKESNMNTFVEQNKFNGEAPIIQTTTVDDFVKDKEIDFIRMDIEGFEYELFSGMEKLIKSKKPLKIMMEFHSDLYDEKRDFKKKVRLLKENNFKAKYLVTWDKPYTELMVPRGYKPLKIINDSPNTRALYKDVKMDDLIELLKKRNVIRAALFERK